MHATKTKPQGRTILCVGASGCGKTTLCARSVAWSARHHERPVLVYDHTGDVASYLAEELKELEYAPQLRHVKSASEARTVTAAGFFTARRDIAIFGKKESAQFVWAASSPEFNGAVVFVDEAHFVFPNSHLGERHSEIIEVARNRGIELLLASQLPQQLNMYPRANADWVAIFRQQVDSAVKSLSDRVDKDLVRPAKKLAKGKYLVVEKWRKDPEASLPVYDNIDSPVPWHEVR